MSQGKRLTWMPGEQIDPTATKASSQRVLSVVRRVIDPLDYEKTVAVIRVDLPFADVEQALGKAVVAVDSAVWLVNESGEVLVQSNPSLEAAPSSKAMTSYLAYKGWQAS